jgi:signal transduction histidine kinase
MKHAGAFPNKHHRSAGHPRQQTLADPTAKLNRELERQLTKRTGEVRQKTRQLRAMAGKLTQVEGRERRRLAENLHSHIQQLLLAARLHLSLVDRGQLAMAGREAVGMADKIIGEAMGDCRLLAVDLSPPVLHEAGLGAALEWLARRMVQLHRFTVDLHIDSRAEPRSAEVRVFLFEAVRELLLNACKHSGCTIARVKMTREPNNWLRVAVEDAGKGLDPVALATGKSGDSGFGLSSIRQRLMQLGARMELRSAPGAGTRIDILARITRSDNRDPVSSGRTALATGQKISNQRCDSLSSPRQAWSDCAADAGASVIAGCCMLNNIHYFRPQLDQNPGVATASRA